MSSTTSSATVTNGVDRRRLKETIAAVKADPSLAAFLFRLANQWVDGGLNRSTIEDYAGTNQEHRHAVRFELANDEPPVLLSGDQAPNPVEYLLHALAGCLTTSLVYHAAARNITVSRASARLEGDLDLQGFLGVSDQVRRGFHAIRVAFEIEAPVSEAEKNELIALAMRHSPVFDSVSNGVPVTCMLAETSRGPAN